MSIRRMLALSVSGALLIASTALAGQKDPLQIYVSKDTQSLVVYDGTTVVATSNVSTGKPGHDTPTGIFSILEKQKIHHSNLYDDAPMPFMQRITWSGVALHESGHVPRYPASHGCVRMPKKFAQSLYGITSRGFHVIITNRQITPHELAGSAIFQPRAVVPADLLSDAQLRASMDSSPSTIEVAMADQVSKPEVAAGAEAEPLPPIKMLITRISERERLRIVQELLTQIGYEPGRTDGIYNGQTRKAIKAFQDLHGQKQTGTVTADVFNALHRMTNRKPATGRLYVRQNFKPLFEADVDIANPEQALGTNFYQAYEIDQRAGTAKWVATTLDNTIEPWREQRLGIASYPDATAPDAAEQAFARIGIQPEISDRIASLLGNGSSLTIADISADDETGEGTEFITTTREPVATK